MTMKHSHIYATPLGPVLIESTKSAISLVRFGGALDVQEDAPDAVTNAFAGQLLEYLAGKRRVFDVTLALAGSSFQEAVWAAIQDIPYGQVRTCTDIANSIGQPTSRRQIGRAASACPCPVVVPIHRVSSLDDALSVHLRGIESADA